MKSNSDIVFMNNYNNMAYGYSNKIAYFEGFLEVKESKEMFLSSILVEPFSKGHGFVFRNCRTYACE